ncbi:MAG: hypothetical protein IJT91_00630 [Clostridia bacterium]|nr:hypothetical protein [Clostridia bacterium]
MIDNDKNGENVRVSSDERSDHSRLHEAASAALECAVEAIAQVGCTAIETKKTIRTEKTDPELGKVITTEEERSIRLVEAPIDVSALRQITATLKDIRDLIGDGSGDDNETGVIFLPSLTEGFQPKG